MNHSPRVFLSYCSADRALARRIVRGLFLRGFECWIDEEALQAGDRLTPVISKAISRSAVVLILTTAASASSRWVHREFECARRGLFRRRAVYPLLAECGCNAPWLDHAKGFDVSSEHNIQEFYSTLIGLHEPPKLANKTINVRGNEIFESLIADHPHLTGLLTNLRGRRLLLAAGGALSDSATDRHAVGTAVDVLSLTSTEGAEANALGICIAGLYPATGVGIDYLKRTILFVPHQRPETNYIFGILCSGGKYRNASCLVEVIDLVDHFAFARPLDIGALWQTNRDVFTDELFDRLIGKLDMKMKDFSFGYIELIIELFRERSTHEILYRIVKFIFRQESAWPLSRKVAIAYPHLTYFLDELSRGAERANEFVLKEYMTVFAERSRSSDPCIVISCLRALLSTQMRSVIRQRMIDVLSESIMSAEAKRSQSQEIRNAVLDVVTVIKARKEIEHSLKRLNQLLSEHEIEPVSSGLFG